jgi:hypothetical protein
MIAPWKGSKDLHEQSDSPKIVTGKDGIEVTRVFIGPYQKVLADAPSYGSAMAGFDGCIITRIEQVHQDGGSGKLTLVALNVSQPPPSTYQNPPEPVYESDWTEVQKDLKWHPIYQSGPLSLVSGDGFEYVSRYMALFEGGPRSDQTDEQWRDELGDLFANASSGAKHLITRLKRGQDSYNVYVHVVRETSYSPIRPTPAPCNVRQSPPVFALNGMVYVRSADRITSGSPFWSRQREWLGFDEIDEDLIP